MHTVPSGRILFGVFELDLSTGELRSIEAPDPNNPDLNNKVILREQVFQVLRLLLEREGKIVTREEIKGRLWPNDTVVDFDRSINATITTLRRTLGDSADNPRYIETLVGLSAQEGLRRKCRPISPRLQSAGAEYPVLACTCSGCGSLSQDRIAAFAPWGRTK
jgi:DNA-binding winged helix-turn-helix (wHTH) protein